MRTVNALLRSFSIRTRMLGAIALVLGMFALVGLVGVAGGIKIKSLNEEFMEHSIHEIDGIAQIRTHLAKVRLLEKQMVIDYEDGVAVLKHRELWTAELAATRRALESMLESEEDEDNAVVRESLQKLTGYVQRSESVLSNIQNGAYDNARVADRMLSKAKEEIHAVEANVDRIAKLVASEVESTATEFKQVMLTVLVAFAATVGLVVVLVVPLTLMNSHSITSPIGYAAQVAEAISNGDLTRPIRVEGKDEAALLQYFPLQV